MNIHNDAYQLPFHVLAALHYVAAAVVAPNDAASGYVVPPAASASPFFHGVETTR